MVGRGGGSLVHRGSLVYRGSLVSRGSLVYRGSLVSRDRDVSRGSLVDRVLGLAVIGDISDVAVVAIHVVVDVLGPAVGESHGVGALGIAGAIAGLSGVEGRLGVVIGHSIGVGVGKHLISVCLGMVGRGSVVGRGRSVVGRGSLNYGSMVGRGGVDHMSMVGRGGSMVDGGSNLHHRGVVDWGSLVEAAGRSSMDGMGMGTISSSQGHKGRDAQENLGVEGDGQVSGQLSTTGSRE